MVKFDLQGPARLLHRGRRWPRRRPAEMESAWLLQLVKRMDLVDTLLLMVVVTLSCPEGEAYGPGGD